VAATESIRATVKKRSGRLPVLIFAAITFAVINLCCAELVREHLLKHPVNDDPNIVLAHYSQLTSAPNVVLVGSSTIRFPLWLSDLKHGSGIGDYDHYGQCAELEKQVKELSGKSLSIFDLGINAAMASDVYLIEEQLFKGKLKPQTVIYALAPRDFMDDLVPNETRTEPFERLYQFADVIREDRIFKTSLTEKTDLLLRRNIPLYQYRWQCQEKVKTVVNKVVDKVFKPFYAAQNIKAQPSAVKGQTSATKGQTSPFKAPPRAKAQPAIEPPEVSKLAPSDFPHHKDVRWLKSIIEYEDRYAYANYDQYKRQKKALESMLELSKQRGITVLLVRVPVTETELGLDPPNYSEGFSTEIGKIAKAHGVRFVDLQESHQYTSSDFFDVAHLNTDGGEKLSRALATEISAICKNNKP
jgi:hypothetical protein